MDRPPSHRLSVLERLLGLGRFQLLDGGDGPKREIRWSCGCEARETDGDRYAVRPCARHREHL